jgi:hypothetical protein
MAVIDWGDGTTSAGTVRAKGTAGGFNVRGSRTNPRAPWRGHTPFRSRSPSQAAIITVAAPCVLLQESP